MSFVDEVQAYLDSGQGIIDLPTDLGCGVASVELHDSSDYVETTHWVFQLKTLHDHDECFYFTDEYVLVSYSMVTDAGKAVGFPQPVPMVYAVEPYDTTETRWRPV